MQPALQRIATIAGASVIAGVPPVATGPAVPPAAAAAGAAAPSTSADTMAQARRDTRVGDELHGRRACTSIVRPLSAHFGARLGRGASLQRMATRKLQKRCSFVRFCA